MSEDMREFMRRLFAPDPDEVDAWSATPDADETPPVDPTPTGSGDDFRDFVNQLFNTRD